MTPIISALTTALIFPIQAMDIIKRTVSNATIPYPTHSKTILFSRMVSLQRASRPALSFSLDNTIETKLKPKSTDTSGKARKVPLLEGLTFHTFYNFAAGFDEAVANFIFGAYGYIQSKG